MSIKFTSKRFAGKNTGFTLIEVLVAISVFSIGLLGLAGLQLTAMKNNKSSHSRTMATILAQDIADRARANSVELYDYDGTGSAPGLNTACESTGGCTTAQMKDHDITTWLNTISNSPDLPNARGIVCVDSVPDTLQPGAATPAGGIPLPNCDGIGNISVVYIDWTDHKDDQNNTGDINQRFIMSF